MRTFPKPLFFLELTQYLIVISFFLLNLIAKKRIIIIPVLLTFEEILRFSDLMLIFVIALSSINKKQVIIY